jgi:hypothetical protein
MKNVIRLIGLAAFASAIAFSLATCKGAGVGGGGGGTAAQDPWAKAPVTNISTAAGLATALNNITAPGYYVMNVTAPLTFTDGIVMKGKGVNIALQGPGGNRAAAPTGSAIILNGDALKIEDGAACRLASITVYSDTSDDGALIFVGGSGSSLEIMNGAVITAAQRVGIITDGGSVTMSGGEIKDCGGQGVFLEASSSFTMKGGTINGNIGDGVSIQSNNNGVTMSGGVIRNNNDGIHFLPSSTNSTLNITGGTISGNDGIGVCIENRNINVTMSGGTISDNAMNGVCIEGENNNFTMSGGSIGGNNFWGLTLWRGVNLGFEKQKGAVIYGNTSGNKNANGAISVFNFNGDLELLALRDDADSGAVYAAKINAAGNGIDSGSKVGDWD